MRSHLAWFAVVLGGGLGVAGAFRLLQLAVPAENAREHVRRAAIVFLLCGVGLAILGALYKIHRIAEIDSRLAVELVADRSTALTQVMTIVTESGDVVPTFALSATLALVFYLRTNQIRAWLLPVVVFIQVVLQDGFLHVVHDWTLLEVSPGISIGGSDGIPSGAMSRLLAIFAVAAFMWRPKAPIVAQRLLMVGAVVVLVELITRIYLGRHLLADIAGGLLLGVMLATAFGWLLLIIDAHRPATTGTSAVE